MSTREAMKLVSRAITLYLIVWVLTDLTYLPEKLFALVHYVREGPALSAYGRYLRESYLIGVAFLVTRIVGLALLARWFYKGGRGVETLLLGSKDQASEPRAN